MSTSYRDLDVWQKAIKLVVAVYEATERFPRSELYGMMSQMRRAVTSIPANIAEGYGRSPRQRYTFLENSLGSVYELETHIEVAKHLHFLAGDVAISLERETATIGRGLNGLLAYVEKEARNQPKRRQQNPRSTRGTGVSRGTRRKPEEQA